MLYHLYRDSQSGKNAQEEAVFQEVVCLPCFPMTWTDSAEAMTLESMLRVTQNHKANILRTCIMLLQSKEYMQIRNAILILMAIIKVQLSFCLKKAGLGCKSARVTMMTAQVFPHINSFAKRLISLVEVVKKQDARQDLRTQAGMYLTSVRQVMKAPSRFLFLSPLAVLLVC